MLTSIYRRYNRCFMGEGCLFFLTLIFDRFMFYLFFKNYYQKRFKQYGNNIRWGRDFRRFLIPKNIRIGCPEKISIGDNCCFDEFVYLQCDEKGEGMNIEEGVRINSHTHVLSGSHIHIAKNTLIAPYSLITSNNHVYERPAPIMFQGMKASGPISIGEGSWLGQGAKILGGVSLGKKTVVAAGAIVVRGTYPDEAIMVSGFATIKSETLS
jgi:acetyltransferase-like isoleucine patch superfamily enzyme